MIVGVDAGNYEVKVVWQRGVDRFPSDLGEYRERKLEQVFSKDDMVVEYDGKKYFAGTLAKYESEFNARMMGESKAHLDCKLRVLIALHRVEGSSLYKIIVGQPIDAHTKEEKEVIKRGLKGFHTISINGRNQTFMIEQVEVAAEGGSAFWSAPQDDLVRIIDIGSGTVNCATLHDKRYIDKDSFSLMLGANTTKTQDYQAMARAIAAEAGKKWGKNDVVKVAGGPAESLLPYLQEYFPKADIIRPFLNGQILPPVFANAVGFYRIGVEVYAG
jgi:plasmid segregation protein ParM